MTYIKEIDLDNFKSFSGHVKFTFINGFNIVAGANGSGKSNIVDAILFVLGGSSKKEMRSEVFTDLIFNGGKAHNPAEYTKVNIIFDNSDKTFQNFEENEVSISRKVDKSGKSVFRINGKASTKEEILNILSIIKVRQDSFNIIPQGKIERITNSSSEEKLSIINDISGISVFEEKKAKSMNEMKKVEDNISKIETVLNEKKKLMDKLENEKKRALEFKELKNEQILMGAKRALMRKNSALDALNSALKATEEAENKLHGILSEKESIRKQISDAREEVNEINTRAESEGEKEISESEKKSKELDIELSKLRSVLNTDNEQLERLEETLTEVKGSIKDTSEESKREDLSITSLKEELDKLGGKRHELVEATLEADKLIREKDALEKKLGETNQKVYEYKLALSNYPKSAELQSRLSEVNARKSKLESEYKEMTFKFSDLKPQVDKLRSDIKTESDTVYWLKERLLNQKSSIASRNKAVDASEKLKKEVHGVHGTVNELFSIKNDKYIDAIQRSIGNRGDFIVVDDDTIASRCIQKLKLEKLGSFNFIPLNKIVHSELGQKPDMGFVIDYTVNLVSFDDKFSNAMKFVFSDTLLVESFESAKSMIAKYRMVTVDGTILERTGVISGGYREVVNFSEMNKKYKELLKEMDEHTALKEKYETELTEKEPLLTYFMSMVKAYEKDLADIREDAKSIGQELSSFAGSESDITDAIGRLESEKLSMEEKLRGLESRKIERVDNKHEIEALDRDINSMQIKLGTATSKVETLLRSELNNLLKREAELEKERQKFTVDITRTEDRIKQDEKELETVTSDLNRKSGELVNLRKRRDTLQKQAGELEINLSKLDDNLNKVQTEVNIFKVKEAELRVKFETMEEEFNRHAVEGITIDEKDTLQTIEKKLSSLDSKVASFGPINELALETFNKTMQEYSVDTEKLTKLNEEKERILSVIKDIESKKLEAFMKTLSDINEVFSSVFNSITGGKAELVPDNPEDVFKGGLDIKVDLPNKKVHNVRGLSGGEKSILSIALILSISKYIDVPFYVLDEVDAALDSINSSKFSGLVEAYSKRTEFIIISHNEATMLNADVIYGVTMSQEGVSKAVSVKMPKEKLKSSE